MDCLSTLSERLSHLHFSRPVEHPSSREAWRSCGCVPTRSIQCLLFECSSFIVAVASLGAVNQRPKTEALASHVVALSRALWQLILASKARGVGNVTGTFLQSEWLVHCSITEAHHSFLQNRFACVLGSDLLCGLLGTHHGHRGDAQWIKAALCWLHFK